MSRRIVFALLLAGYLQAEPQHMLEYLLPRGGMRGSAVEVNLHGQYLNDPREVVFYGGGITALFPKFGGGWTACLRLELSDAVRSRMHMPL